MLPHTYFWRQRRLAQKQPVTASALPGDDDNEPVGKVSRETAVGSLHQVLYGRFWVAECMQ